MSTTDRCDHGAAPLSPAIEAAVRALRAEVPVRADWRAAVLRDALDGRRVPAPPARLTVTRRAAIAASLGFTLLGGAAGLAAARWLGARAQGTAAPAATRADPAPPRVRFALVAPAASRVSVVGDFNAWNPAATPLRRAADGRVWAAEVPVTPGRHVYAFIVDGVLVVDPGAPRAGDEDFGVPSSVVIVRGAET